MVALEYRIDLSRLDVIELDNRKYINEFNKMLSEQRDSNSDQYQLNLVDISLKLFLEIRICEVLI